VLGSSASTIQVDAGKTLTIPTAITGTGALTKTGSGTLALTSNSSYSGGTTDSAGVITVSVAANPLGTGTVTLAGGNLSLLGNQGPVPVALTGFNQDVIWGGGEATPTVGTTTTLDGTNVLYDTTVFSPGGGLPANGSITSQSNPAVTFQLQPYC
jgi:autotransporter-associated beta strand protein